MQVIHDDPSFIAVNKPSGLFTQAARGVPSLYEDLITFLSALNKAENAKVYVGLVHRLDRPTSGVILFAKTATALRNLNEQFRVRKVAKTYLAIVTGQPPLQGEAEDWLRKIPDVAKAELCDHGDDQAKRALLQWTRLARDEQYSLLQIELQTGRMHQIRLQLASRGWPIVGDALYGENDRAGEVLPFGLHAATLSFHHPKTAKRLTLTASPPAAWYQFFAALLNA